MTDGPNDLEAPALTVAPGSNRIPVTSPPISGVIVTWWTAATDPMPVAKRGTLSLFAVTAAI